jgi:hypothetical protein
MRARPLDLVLAAACASCGGGGTNPADADATGVATATAPETGDTVESAGSTGSSTDGGTSPTEADSSESSTTSTGDGSSSGSMSADSTGIPGDGSSGDPPPPANLFENPSLEDWPDAAEPNTPPGAWTDCSSPGGLAVDAVPDSCDAQPATASEGERYARGFDGEGIAQTIATTVGTTYAITFDYCAVDACFGGAASSRWEVLVDDVVVLTTDADVGTSWTAAATTFEAAAATTTICLRKAADGGQGGLDNLVLHEQ